MAIQPETLKFGPQWLRKLSDCSYSSKFQLDQSTASAYKLENTSSNQNRLLCDQESIKNACYEDLGIDNHWNSVCVSDLKGKNDFVVDRSHKSTNASPHSSQCLPHNGYLDGNRDPYSTNLPTDIQLQSQHWSTATKWSSSSSSTTRPNPSNINKPVGFSPDLSTWQPHSTPPSTSSLDVVGPLSNSHSYPFTSFDDERGMQQPDGTDRPDEHMWLYEDPQGRTQGSFSDAQMNDWLLAGIYFTPTLRIRRTCDDTFSTLAEYSQLFGRIPFSSGPRIAPIRGGISAPMLHESATTQLISKTSSASQHLGLGVDSLSMGLDRLSTGVSVSSLIQTTGNCPVETSVSDLAARVSTLPPNHSTTYGLNVGSTLLSSTSNPQVTLSNDPTGIDSISTSGDFFVNSTLPVLRSKQMTSFPNTVTSMNENTSPLCEDSQSTSNFSPQPVTSSALMALASLISINPALASLASNFSNQCETDSVEGLISNNPALASGFLSALAQYLNVQPPSAGYSTTSPMQQLAETTRLATQLAAMAGAHSPDQTPMQPTQALVLAQMIMAQATSSSLSQWSSPVKHFGNGSDGADRQANNISEHFVQSSSSSAVSTISGPLGKQSLSDSQHAWPTLQSTSSTKKKCPVASFRSADTRLSSAKVSQGPYNDNSTTCNDFPGGAHPQSTNVLSPNSRQSSKLQQKGSLPPIGSKSSNKSKTANGTASISDSSNLDATHHALNSRGNSSDADATCDGTLTARSQLGRAQQSATFGTWVENKAKPNQKSFTNNKIMKSAGKSQQSTSDIANTRPQPSLDSIVQKADDELERLTQWCQIRLSSMPMREKVDIPTVVELLATLDAPYEVEQMVQTFLGESTRTNSFVKEFLDRRRPFWKLHRERRENESLAKRSDQATCSLSNGNPTRSADKKAKSTTSGQDGVNPTASSHRHCGSGDGANGSGGSRHETNEADANQDSQWHYIKPKGGHHRKSKKDKTS